MNLAVVNEAVTEMNGVEHQFTEEEKNFVVQFAFRSGSKEDTISLIEALAHSADKAESDEIMVTYRATIIGEAELLAYDDYAGNRLNHQKSQRKFYNNSPYQILMSFDEEQEIVQLLSKMAKNRTEV